MADQKQLVEKLHRCIKEVHTTFYSTMSDTVSNNIEKFCEELFSRRVISSSVKKLMNYSQVIDEFWAGLVWKKSVRDVECHCEAFLQSLVAIGPNGVGAAHRLREDWAVGIKKEMGISFLSDLNFAASVDEPRPTQARLPLDEVIKKSAPRLTSLITDPDKLTVELWSEEFIGDSMKDDVLTINLSNMAKANKLIHEVYVYFGEYNDRQKMETFCNILRRTCNPGIEKVVDEMLSKI